MYITSKMAKLGLPIAKHQHTADRLTLRQTQKNTKKYTTIITQTPLYPQQTYKNTMNGNNLLSENIGLQRPGILIRKFNKF